LKDKAMTVLPGNNETQREMFLRTQSFKAHISSLDTTLPILTVNHSGIINALKSTAVNDDGSLDVQGHVGLCSVHVINV
jgi:broad specificity phosphatase PhoE